MDQAQTIFSLANAWLKVKLETIKNCWQHTKILAFKERTICDFDLVKYLTSTLPLEEEIVAKLNGTIPNSPGNFDNKFTVVSQLNLEADESEMIVCYTTSTTNNEGTAEGNVDETEENDNTEQDEQRVDIVECKKWLREAYETILMHEVPLDDLDRKLHRRIQMRLADSCAELSESKEQTDLRSYFTNGGAEGNTDNMMDEILIEQFRLSKLRLYHSDTYKIENIDNYSESDREMTAYRLCAKILDCLFSGTGLRLLDDEPGCIAMKEEIVLSRKYEIKTKNVLAMDFIGSSGYMHTLEKKEGVYVASLIEEITLPTNKSQIKHVLKTVNALFTFKNHMTKLAAEVGEDMEVRVPAPKLKECGGRRTSRPLTNFESGDSNKPFKTCEICRHRQTPVLIDQDAITDREEFPSLYPNIDVIEFDGAEHQFATLKYEGYIRCEELADLAENDTIENIEGFKLIAKDHVSLVELCDGYAFYLKDIGTPELQRKVKFSTYCTQDNRIQRMDTYECNGTIHGVIDLINKCVHLKIEHNNIDRHPPPPAVEHHNVEINNLVRSFIRSRVRTRDVTAIYNELITEYSQSLVTLGQIYYWWNIEMKEQYRLAENQFDSRRMLIERSPGFHKKNYYFIIYKSAN
ncbi:hypothetical protein G6F46_002985 [Rhizopus delemar]|nr:hypothetical protein G6F51_000827 [Rhizopus arrhizus]KAG1573697.1 hypothetical protein G6F50_002621 [Rhizopus delemar]KAG1594296.1 hypothetical protein G6F48_001454 [Rhizopus delemar]KAG1603920.1 hypothetical protein G6F47_001393 [Rhizopus delemar]KAG1619664.1 hypothetical protein G6F46_002985 [Rhizopus delemar]